MRRTGFSGRCHNSPGSTQRTTTAAGPRSRHGRSRPPARQPAPLRDTQKSADEPRHRGHLEGEDAFKNRTLVMEICYWAIAHVLYTLRMNSQPLPRSVLCGNRVCCTASARGHQTFTLVVPGERDESSATSDPVCERAVRRHPDTPGDRTTTRRGSVTLANL